jgi:uncharacterized protein (TIGR00255 family)
MPVRSMTGFGTATEEGVVVEARSVNGRQLDVKARHPFGPGVDTRIRTAVSQRIGRGRVDVRVRIASASDRPQSTADAVARWAPAVRQVTELAVEYGLEVAPVNPLELLDFSLKRSDGNSAEEPVLPHLDRALGRALDQLLETRVAEGAALEEALRRELDGLQRAISVVSAAVASEPAALQERWRARVEALVGEAVDPGVIAREVALLVQKGDVTEELDRLGSHFEQFSGVLNGSAEVGQGRRLDFLCQELQREVNTIQSKVASHAASTAALDAKAAIERIREQAQNVE